ncbi:hypothetical protein [Nocardioides sp.]|uniref:hypothetical protein n=1 Tax=Nocardioides sp. TaxID=35761 RepID=UPI00199D9D24|nr:hypothetical protein [Nocardioides sp.]MBC7276771.1 hypothetical protein [Nocardioides sp.]
MSERRDDHLETDTSDESGEVSEVQQLDPEAAETPVAPSDSTAGYPESESGEPDTRGSGPDSAPPENRRDNETT